GIAEGNRARAEETPRPGHPEQTKREGQSGCGGGVRVAPLFGVGDGPNRGGPSHTAGDGLFRLVDSRALSRPPTISSSSPGPPSWFFGLQRACRRPRQLSLSVRRGRHVA